MTNWQEFFEKLQGYEAQFKFYGCDRGVTAEQLYQAFRGRMLDELFEASLAVDNEDLAIVLQRMVNNDPHETMRTLKSQGVDSYVLEELLDQCPDAECSECAKIFCPDGEPLHFHHDGCPACDG